MKVYQNDIAVEWAHCDAVGIVFYPNFYIWFDQATGRLFSANNLSYPELAKFYDCPGMPLLETGATYKNACQLGDQIHMETWIDEWSGKTYLVKHKLTHADGRPALEGFERRIWIKRDLETPTGMRAVPVPQEVIDRFID